MSLKPCPRCGHENRQEAPTCPNCETMLPARHKVLRNVWLAVAIPFTILSIISLLISLIQGIGGTKLGDATDITSLTNLLSVVLVPFCIALIGWVNYFDHKK